MRWNVGLLAGLLVFTSAEAGCSATPVASLPLYPLETGKYAVPVTINGREYRLEVDTGAQDHALAASVVDELGLEKTKLATKRGTMVGGAPLDTLVTAKDVAIGALKAKSLSLFALTDARLHGSDGLLADKLYKDFDVDLDYGAGRMNLFRPCSGRGAYWQHKAAAATIAFNTNAYDHILIPATIGGKNLTVRIDTGASELVLDVKALAFFGLTTSSPGVNVTSSSGTHWYHYTFDALTLGDWSLPKPEVAFITGGPASQLFVGSDLLRHYHVLISYLDKTLTITPSTDDQALKATLDAFDGARDADIHHDPRAAMALYSQAISAGNLPRSYLAAAYRGRAMNAMRIRQCTAAVADIHTALKLDPLIADARRTAADTKLQALAATCPDYPFQPGLTAPPALSSPAAARGPASRVRERERRRFGAGVRRG